MYLFGGGWGDKSVRLTVNMQLKLELQWLLMGLLVTFLACIIAVTTPQRCPTERLVLVDPNFELFLLTLPSSVKRRDKFFKHHRGDVPVHVRYGADTKDPKVATLFKHCIAPGYLEVALNLGQTQMERPDTTYFNLGAIGCYFGHLRMWRDAVERHVKYAVICEDNVLLRPSFYTHVNRVIDDLQDNFDAVFLYNTHRYTDNKKGEYDVVKWIAATKCYLIHVPTFAQYQNVFLPMDNHIDSKFEDAVAAGARVFYRKFHNALTVDTSGPSTIQHTKFANPKLISRRYPHLTHKHLKR